MLHQRTLQTMFKKSSEVSEAPQGYHIATRGKNKGKYIKNRSTTSYTQDETLDEWTERRGYLREDCSKTGNRAYLEDWSEDVGKNCSSSR